MTSPHTPLSGDALPAERSLRVETGKGHKRGKRGRSRDIQKVSRERQAGWLETGLPDLTDALTRRLDGLYDEHRGEQAGTFTGPYRGKTSGVSG